MTRGSSAARKALLGGAPQMYPLLQATVTELPARQETGASLTQEAAVFPKLTWLEGTLERIIFANEDNGYTVARFLPKGSRSPNAFVTIVGMLLGVNIGESLVLEGQWNAHPRHGQQFEVCSCRVELPATIEGMRKYLGSGLIKGIGPVMASRIVSTFGLATLHIMENNPERLKEVTGLGQVLCRRIRESWLEQKAIKEVMIFLAGQQVPATLAVRIYKKYGDAAIHVVRHDPYRLAREVFGVGFLTADRIAQNIGIPSDSLDRAMAGLLYILWAASEEGHIYLPQPVLLERAMELLEIGPVRLEEALEFLVSNREVYQEPISNLNGQAADASTLPSALYLNTFYRAETGLAGRIRALQYHPLDRLETFRRVDFARACAYLQQREQVKLAEKQQEAVRVALTHKFSILTGGPGTGKTTTMRSIIALLRAKALRFVLAAPTGRAAKRLSEVTGEEATTLHRLLGIGIAGASLKPLYDAEHPLDTDMVIVDEVSMLDLLLAHTLVKAIAPGTHLLFVGDCDQLPAVGAGNVLRDLLESNVIPVVRLELIFRQALESGIVAAAHRINSGALPEFSSMRSVTRDCFFLEEADENKAAELVVELAHTRLPQRYGLDPLRDIQVLSPMHRDKLGIAELNIALQEALNPPGPQKAERRFGGRLYREGDRVLCIRNNYDKTVFNGDHGWIERINPVEQTIYVRFDDIKTGHLATYEFSELDELIHAYAMSVHKAQGSEFPVVIALVHIQHRKLLQRNLLYTAITRARRLVVLVGTRRALEIGVNNDRVGIRYSGLKWRLGIGSEYSPSRLSPQVPE